MRRGASCLRTSYACPLSVRIAFWCGKGPIKQAAITMRNYGVQHGPPSSPSHPLNNTVAFYVVPQDLFAISCICTQSPQGGAASWHGATKYNRTCHYNRTM